RTGRRGRDAGRVTTVIPVRRSVCKTIPTTTAPTATSTSTNTPSRSRSYGPASTGWSAAASRSPRSAALSTKTGKRARSRSPSSGGGGRERALTAPACYRVSVRVPSVACAAPCARSAGLRRATWRLAPPAARRVGELHAAGAGGHQGQRQLPRNDASGVGHVGSAHGRLAGEASAALGKRDVIDLRAAA